MLGDYFRRSTDHAQHVNKNESFLAWGKKKIVNRQSCLKRRPRKVY